MKSPITAEQAKARIPLAAMTALVDLRDWENLTRCFAERITVDYTSLWGGSPQQATGKELVEQWRALLPGFDATRHELGKVEIKVEQNQAQAEAPVTGTHILDEQAWIVEGRYLCELVRHATGWRIAALKYINSQEQGNRELVALAKARAAQLAARA